MKRQLFVSLLVAISLVLSGCGGNTQCGVGPGGQVIMCQHGQNQQQAAATLTQGIIDIATAAVASPMSDPLLTPMPTNSGFSPLPAQTQVEIYPIQTQVPPNAGYDAAPTREYAIIEQGLDEGGQPILKVPEELPSMETEYQEDGNMLVTLTDSNGTQVQFICRDNCDPGTIRYNGFAFIDGALIVTPDGYSSTQELIEVTTSGGTTFWAHYADLVEIRKNVDEVCKPPHNCIVAYYKMSPNGINTALGQFEIRKIDKSFAEHVGIATNATMDRIADAFRSMDPSTEFRIVAHGSAAHGWADFGSDVDLTLDITGTPLSVLSVHASLQSKTFLADLFAGSGLEEINILLIKGGEPGMTVTIPIP